MPYNNYGPNNGGARAPTYDKGWGINRGNMRSPYSLRAPAQASPVASSQGQPSYMRSPYHQAGVAGASPVTTQPSSTPYARAPFAQPSLADSGPGAGASGSVDPRSLYGSRNSRIGSLLSGGVGIGSLAGVPSPPSAPPGPTAAQPPASPPGSSQGPQDYQFSQGPGSWSPEAYSGGPYGSIQAMPTAADFQASPGYEFVRDEAMRGIQASAAARGLLGSTGTIQDMQNRAAGLASTEYQNFVGNQFNARDFMAGRNDQNFNQYMDGQGLNRTANQDAFGNWLNAEQMKSGQFNTNRNFVAGRADTAYNQFDNSRRFDRDSLNSDRDFGYKGYRDQVGDYNKLMQNRQDNLKTLAEGGPKLATLVAELAVAFGQSEANIWTALAKMQSDGLIGQANTTADGLMSAGGLLGGLFGGG